MVVGTRSLSSHRLWPSACSLCVTLVALLPAVRSPRVRPSRTPCCTARTAPDLAPARKVAKSRSCRCRPASALCGRANPDGARAIPHVIVRNRTRACGRESTLVPPDLGGDVTFARSTPSSQSEIRSQAELPHHGQVLAAPPSKTVLHSASRHSTADSDAHRTTIDRASWHSPPLPARWAAGSAGRRPRIQGGAIPRAWRSFNSRCGVPRSDQVSGGSADTSVLAFATMTKVFQSHPRAKHMAAACGVGFSQTGPRSRSGRTPWHQRRPLARSSRTRCRAPWRARRGMSPSPWRSTKATTPARWARNAGPRARSDRRDRRPRWPRGPARRSNRPAAAPPPRYPGSAAAAAA